MAENSLKWLKMALKIAGNDWKGFNGCKWLEIDGNG